MKRVDRLKQQGAASGWRAVVAVSADGASDEDPGWIKAEELVPVFGRAQLLRPPGQ